MSSKNDLCKFRTEEAELAASYLLPGKARYNRLKSQPSRHSYIMVATIADYHDEGECTCVLCRWANGQNGNSSHQTIKWLHHCIPEHLEKARAPCLFVNSWPVSLQSRGSFCCCQACVMRPVKQSAIKWLGKVALDWSDSSILAVPFRDQDRIIKFPM